MSEQTKQQQQVEAWAAREVDSASRDYPPAPQPIGITAVSYAEIGYRNIKLQEANEGLWNAYQVLVGKSKRLAWWLGCVSILFLCAVAKICDMTVNP